MSYDYPNVVLVTADSVRADACGFLNDERTTTPHLDELADESLVFRNAIAPGPRTLSSVPEMLTGTPMPHAVEQRRTQETRMEHISDHVATHETLPERLEELGYTTAAHTANPWTRTATDFDSCFDRFHESVSPEPSRLRQVTSRLSLPSEVETLLFRLDQWHQSESFFSTWESSYDQILDLVGSLDEPYFLWVFLLEPHNPYVPPRADRVESSTLGMYYANVRGNSLIQHSDGDSQLDGGMSAELESRLQRAYRDAIRSVDRFVATLQADILDDDTVLAFTSDHGESFGDHGTYGHQQELYEENIHVPCLLSVPTEPWDGEIPRPVGLRELPSILLDVVTDEGWSPEEVPATDYAIADTTTGNRVAVRGHRWKLIVGGRETELYDLEADPGETTNLHGDVDISETPLDGLLSQYLDGLSTWRPSDERGDLPQETRDRLRAIGYVD